MDGAHGIAAEGVAVEVDLGIGHLARVEVHRDGRCVAPYHRVPWLDDGAPPEGTEEAPHLARMAGDFFCAPFGKSDVEPSPPHGWPANSAWSHVEDRRFEGGVTAAFELDRRVLGARLTKELTLRDGHPFVYQRHVFHGGAGAIPVANHAMVRLPAGGLLSFSPKRFADAPDTPQESDPTRGRSILAYPARTADLTRFPRGDGGTADLTTYPIDEGHEDFVMLVEAEGSALGWSAVVRPQEGDVAIMLKNPARLPMTMLWSSNGGRFFPPWNGRHRHVLGVEDACAWSIHGHAASIAPNPISDMGVPTSVRLSPDGTTDIRHVIGAAPLPSGFGRVSSVTECEGVLVVEDVEGRRLCLPFDASFLA